MFLFTDVPIHGCSCSPITSINTGPVGWATVARKGATDQPQRQPTLAVNLRWTAPTSGNGVETANADGTGNGIKLGNSFVDGIGSGSKTEDYGRGTWSLASARARAVRTLERIACRFARPGTEAELPLPLRLSGDGEGVDQVDGLWIRRYEGDA